MFNTPTRDAATFDRSNFRHRFQMRTCLDSRSDYCEIGSVFSREQVCRDSGNSSSANSSDRRRIHQRQQLARLSAEEQHRTLMRIFTLRRIPGEHTNGLQTISRVITANVRWHQSHHTRCIRRPNDRAQRLMHLPRRKLDKRLTHQRDALLHRQKFYNLIVIQYQDLHGARNLSYGAMTSAPTRRSAVPAARDRARSHNAHKTQLPRLLRSIAFHRNLALSQTLPPDEVRHVRGPVAVDLRE